MVSGRDRLFWVVSPTCGFTHNVRLAVGVVSICFNASSCFDASAARNGQMMMTTPQRLTDDENDDHWMMTKTMKGRQNSADNKMVQDGADDKMI